MLVESSFWELLVKKKSWGKSWGQAGDLHNIKKTGETACLEDHPS